MALVAHSTLRLNKVLSIQDSESVHRTPPSFRLHLLQFSQQLVAHAGQGLVFFRFVLDL